MIVIEDTNHRLLNVQRHGNAKYLSTSKALKTKRHPTAAAEQIYDIQRALWNEVSFDKFCHRAWDLNVVIIGRLIDSQRRLGTLGNGGPFEPQAVLSKRVTTDVLT